LCWSSALAVALTALSQLLWVILSNLNGLHASMESDVTVVAL